MPLPVDFVDVFSSKIDGLGGWLDMFDNADRPVAEALLRHTEFVSRTAFSTWTESTVRAIADSSSSPIAVFAVREMGREESLFPENPDERPVAALGSDIGSEGIAAQLLRSLGRGDERILSHPSINDMRARKTSKVVVVDDIVASGNTAVEYLAALYAHPTIRSWCSRHLLEIHIVAYAVLDEGRRLTSALCNPNGIRLSAYIELKDRFVRVARHLKRRFPPVAPLIHAASDGRRALRTLEKTADSKLRRLCRTYGERWAIPAKWRLGYAEAMALLTFEHGCPNNAPGILWYTSRRGPPPLFAGRVPRLIHVPRWSAQPDDPPPDAAVQRKHRGYVLDCLLRGVRHVSAISRRTGLKPRVVHSILVELRAVGSIDADRRVRSVFPAVRGHRPPGCIEEGSCPYLPRRLRETSDAR